MPVRLEQAIVILLAQHGSLAADQVAAHLREEAAEVQATLRRLRDQGLVDVLAVGELQGHVTTAASYWRLTNAGREAAAV
jgi:predicted ArsR family transcriptional regulator